MLWGVRADSLPHTQRWAGPGKGLNLSCPPGRPCPPALVGPPGNPHSVSTLPFAFQPNETWVNSPVDNCTEYHCQAENGLLVLTPRPVSCPIVSSCRVRVPRLGPAWLPSAGPPSPGAPPLPPGGPTHTPATQRPRPHPPRCPARPTWRPAQAPLSPQGVLQKRGCCYSCEEGKWKRLPTPP